MNTRVSNKNHEISYVLGKKYKNLFAQVDIASLVVFRITFGLIMLIEVFRYFNHNWIARYWIDTEYNFPYWPFEFLKPFGGNGMYYLFILLGVLSFFILMGFLYRMSTTLYVFIRTNTLLESFLSDYFIEFCTNFYSSSSFIFN